MILVKGTAKGSGDGDTPLGRSFRARCKALLDGMRLTLAKAPTSHKR